MHRRGAHRGRTTTWRLTGLRLQPASASHPANHAPPDRQRPGRAV